MTDYQIILQIENLMAAPAVDIRPLLSRWLEGRRQECPSCHGQGWTGYSAESGETCETCVGLAWIGADGSVDPSRLLEVTDVEA